MAIDVGFEPVAVPPATGQGSPSGCDRPAAGCGRAPAAAGPADPCPCPCRGRAGPDQAASDRAGAAPADPDQAEPGPRVPSPWCPSWVLLSSDALAPVFPAASADPGSPPLRDTSSPPAGFAERDGDGLLPP